MISQIKGNIVPEDESHTGHSLFLSVCSDFLFVEILMSGISWGTPARYVPRNRAANKCHRECLHVGNLWWHEGVVGTAQQSGGFGNPIMLMWDKFAFA